MKKYEAVFILDIRKTDDEGAAFSKECAELIANLGGKLESTTPMGRRQFTYEINKRKAGIYFDFIFELEPAKVIEIKEVRLSPNIDTNDLNTKTNAARKFLEKGDKVKVTLRFRGREMAHMAKSKYILDDFAEALSDIAVIDKPSKVEGRTMVMFLTAKK